MNTNPSSVEPHVTSQRPLSLALRSLLGGTMMGLANLVPGISGGTMLLASGVYPRFINAIGEVTRLKFHKLSLLVLACVVGAAVLAIALGAGLLKDMVVNHRWVMYSLFIGLTLGGLPVIWRLIDRRTTSVWVGALAGFIGMAVLGVFQAQGGGGADRQGVLLMFIAGTVGAAAMILPGVSGGYMLLVMGVYVPILAAIDTFKDALTAGDIAGMIPVGFRVILPVGLGVILGVAAVSNALAWLLRRYERPTLGVLLGLLVGAVVGLWPYQQPIAPKPGDTLKNQTVAVDATGGLYLQASGKPVEVEDYPTAFFQPTATQVAAALGLMVLGFALTQAVDHIGKDRSGQGKPTNTGA